MLLILQNLIEYDETNRDKGTFKVINRVSRQKRNHSFGHVVNDCKSQDGLGIRYVGCNTERTMKILAMDQLTDAVSIE